MTPAIRPATPQDIPAICRLLRKAFNESEDTAWLDPELMHWKYYAPGPPWAGSRAFVIEEDAEIVAHSGIWPIHLSYPDADYHGLGFSDWGANPDYPGCGVQLLRYLTKLSSFLIAVGGSDITRKILPKFGFKSWGSVAVYAKVLRPLRQVFTRPQLSWKEPVRFARNTLWAYSRGTQNVVESAPEGLTAYTPEQISFFLACPKAQFVEIEGKDWSALVSVVRGQARLGDLMTEARDLPRIIQCLSVEVKRRTNACELIALASTPQLASAFEANGFRARDHRPCSIFDREGTLASRPMPRLGMLGDDTGFLDAPGSPYMT